MTDLLRNHWLPGAFVCLSVWLNQNLLRVQKWWSIRLGIIQDSQHLFDDLVSCQCRLCLRSWRLASSETCWKILEESPVAWQGFLRCDPRQEHSSVAQLPTGPRRRSVDGRQADVFLRLEVGSSAARQSSSEVLSFRVVRVNWFQRSQQSVLR